MIVFPERKKIAKKNQYAKAIIGTLDAFYRIATSAQWKEPMDIKQTFPEAEVLKDGRVIFDIENQYHLVVKVNLQFGAVHVQFFEPYGKLAEILAESSYLQKVRTA